MEIYIYLRDYLLWMSGRRDGCFPCHASWLELSHTYNIVVGFCVVNGLVDLTGCYCDDVYSLV